MGWVQPTPAQRLGEKPNPATIALETMFVSYANGKADDFNQAVDRYERELAANPPADFNLTKVDYEALFNHFEPFFWAWILDGVPLSSSPACLVRLPSAGQSHGVLDLGADVYGAHAGLVSPGSIFRPAAGDEPVFVGRLYRLGGDVFGIVLEVIYRLGIGNLIASVAGFARSRSPTSWPATATR